MYPRHINEIKKLSKNCDKMEGISIKSSEKCFLEKNMDCV